MTPEEEKIIKDNLKQVAEILYQNTESEKLEDFENVELTVREHLLETVAPTIGRFFLRKQEEKKQEEKER